MSHSQSESTIGKRQALVAIALVAVAGGAAGWHDGRLHVGEAIATAGEVVLAGVVAGVVAYVVERWARWQRRRWLTRWAERAERRAGAWQLQYAPDFPAPAEREVKLAFGEREPTRLREVRSNAPVSHPDQSSLQAPVPGAGQASLS